MDVELYREMSQHSLCAPGSADALVSNAPSKFKGRILPQEDLTALEQVSQIARKTNEKIMVYDVSGVSDKLKAIKRGIWKTPTAIIDGEKYEGFEQIMKAISSKHSS